MAQKKGVFVFMNRSKSEFEGLGKDADFSSSHSVLPQKFFLRPANQVARDLVGCRFYWAKGPSCVAMRIVEVEAYMGAKDLACHASKGLTQRTKIMFGPGGFAYVYLIYGIHSMLNVVCSREGDPQAVLIRAAEPILAFDANLSGPGRLTKSLGVKLLHNGISLCGPKAYFRSPSKAISLGISARIGIDYAGSWKDKPLRFFDKKSSAISRA
jgi:DNA-3-methyladenine glycosylase